MADSEYDLNVVRFIRDHRDYLITAGTGGSGYTAQLKDAYGHGTGQRYSAASLDALAFLLDHAPDDG